jgi:uncharacterized protein YecT (DUF1311 family)
MRIHRTTAILTFILLTVFTSCRLPAADEKHPIDLWLDKEIARQFSDSGMQRATKKAEAMWDREMNKSYGALMSRLQSRQKAALARSQKAWLAYRDAEFLATLEIHGTKSGSMWMTLAVGDQMEIVKERALKLEEYLETLKL